MLAATARLRFSRQSHVCAILTTAALETDLASDPTLPRLALLERFRNITSCRSLKEPRRMGASLDNVLGLAFNLPYRSKRLPMSRFAWVPLSGNINGLFALLIDNAAPLSPCLGTSQVSTKDGANHSPDDQEGRRGTGTATQVAGVLIGGVLYALMTTWPAH